MGGFSGHRAESGCLAVHNAAHANIGVIMQKVSSFFLWVVVGLGMLAQNVYAQKLEIEDNQRLAQAGMKFLSQSIDARAAAMGDAVTAIGGSSVSMFYNPAGMAELGQSVHASFGQVKWIGDIDYNAGAIALQPFGGRYGVVGFSIMAVDYGTFEETIRADNSQGFEDLGTFSPTAMAVGLGYARSLTDRFSVGGNVKYVSQSLGPSVMRLDGSGVLRQDNDATTVAFDFGVLYHTGFRSLTFALSTRNFSREVTYAEENFELPLTFQIGIAMDLMDFTSLETNDHSLSLAVDAKRPRDYAEQIQVGLEYSFLNLLQLRAGYVQPQDEGGLRLGAGLRADLNGIGFGFDYAYTQFGAFGTVNRIGLQVGL